MSSEIYRVLHILGMLMTFTGLVGLWGIYSTGQTPAKSRRIGLALVHGFGMALLLVTGFARMSQLGLFENVPGWIYGKMVIWLLLGGSMVLAKRRAHLGMNIIWLWLVLGVAATYFALLHPF